MCKVKIEVRERFYVEKGCFYHFMSPQPRKDLMPHLRPACQVSPLADFER